MADAATEGKKSIALVGFMGSGKSTVGPLLASRLGMSFVDLDEAICAEAGMSVEEIFAREGEEGFRERESEALRREMEGGGKVVACGGGAVLRRENRSLLRERSLVVYLRVGKDELLRRLGDGEGRPLLAAGSLERRVEELLQGRERAYREVADMVVDAESRDPRDIAEEIARLWKRS